MSTRNRKKPNTKAKTRKTKKAVIPVWSNSPIIQLLDLLAGWASYAAVDPMTKSGYLAECRAKAEHVADLYQAAGALDNPTDDEIRAFVIDRVIPLILTKDGA